METNGQNDGKDKTFVLCKTNRGKGFKICANGRWKYTSIKEMMRLLKDGVPAHFRSISTNESNRSIEEIRENLPLGCSIEEVKL